jgi:hypothetical protein
MATMKKTLLALLMAAALNAGAQSEPMYHRGEPVSYSEPALSNLRFVDGSNTSVNTDLLQLGSRVRMEFTVRNNHALNAVPEGTAMIKITLGTKFRMADDPNMVLLPLNDYFNWTVTAPTHGAQQIITGVLYKELPANFSQQMSLNLIPWTAGNSTATCQLLINNDNAVTVLSDLNPNNNALTQAYKNVKPTGIKFLQFSAWPHACSVDMNWSLFDESKMAKKFTIETSADGINYTAVKTIMATGAGSYNLLLEGINAKSVTVRVKVEAQDGSFVYSTPQLVSNLCSGRFEIGLFPNPVPRDVTELSIIARSGIFNGKYNFKIVDAAGKEIKVIEASYNNQVTVKVGTGMLPAGAYIVNVMGEDGNTVGLKFVKQ